MPKRYFRRFNKDVAYIRTHPRLQFFGELLHDHRLWHFQRRTLAMGAAIGLFVAFIPLPMQMIYAAALAILFRANLPVAVTFIWVSNPITIPPMLFAAYSLGAFLLDMPPNNINVEFSMAWLEHTLSTSWKPLLLGCFILGSSSALIGYHLINWLWSEAVKRDWQQRKEKIKARLRHKKESS
jgi:uncharacterized protein (DUF2062 family)